MSHDNNDDKKNASWNFSIDKSALKVDENKQLKDEQKKKKSINKEKKLRLDFKAVPKQISRAQMGRAEDESIEKEIEDAKFFNRVVKPNLAPVLIFISALVAMVLYKRFK